MIELSRHIEALLLKHNCVIVPHLGGFVAHYVPAQHSSSENLYLPPHRSVGFNPQLTINDGLLVQSYMQAYDTSYPETLRIIEDAISQLKQELQANGEFRLNGIGTLIMNIDGGYDFIANEAGILSPELYGLDAFTIAPIAAPNLKKGNTKALSTTDNAAKEGRNYTFRLNKELVNYAAAAVIAVLFYFAWATPIADSGMSPASSVPTVAAITPAAIPAPQPKTKADNTTRTVQPTVPQQEQTAPQQAQKPEDGPAEKANTKPEHGYSIVLLSCVPQKNAEQFVEKLHEENLPLASVNIKGKMVRVLYGNYVKEAEAYAELNKLRKTGKYFSEAWVMEIK